MMTKEMTFASNTTGTRNFLSFFIIDISSVVMATGLTAVNLGNRRLLCYFFFLINSFEIEIIEVSCFRDR